MSSFVLWITGLPGSGKSTLAEAIRKFYPDFVILRMDTLRQVVTPNPTFSESERDLVYRSLIYVAKLLSELGHNVVIDATGNRRKWRKLARQMITNFAEVYLKCSLEICKKRETFRGETFGAPSNIYKKGTIGWPVPGLQVPYEEPLDPEVVIETDNFSPQESWSIIQTFITRRLG
ncbi:MAG: adenylyl-sulfate kinase [Dissulfurispiraceae bacterium]